jgi:RNA polymerase sigma factor (TIGR02999 family)
VAIMSPRLHDIASTPIGETSTAAKESIPPPPGARTAPARGGDAPATAATPADPSADAVDALIPIVYAELKSLARRQLSRGARNATLSTTVLVHEAYARIATGGHEVVDRRHLMALCARTMRHVVIDHSRERLASKRGGGEATFALAESDIAEFGDPAAIVALDHAMGALEAYDPRLVRLIELRVFAGLEPPEIAELMDITVRTVQRDWLRARAWLGTTLA